MARGHACQLNSGSWWRHRWSRVRHSRGDGVVRGGAVSICSYLLVMDGAGCHSTRVVGVVAPHSRRKPFRVGSYAEGV
jgi:hypothetical protein